MDYLSDRELIFTRIFDAPRALVFKAFSEAEQVRQWWPPKGWEMPVCSLDFRPGGEWRYCFRNAAGEEHWARAIYHKIVPPEQIVFSDEFIDAQGNVIAGLPSKTFTLTFADLGSRTQLTVLVQLASPDNLRKLVEMGFKQGFTETMSNLEQHLLRIKI